MKQTVFEYFSRSSMVFDLFPEALSDGSERIPILFETLRNTKSKYKQINFLKSLSPQFSALTKLLIYILLKTASKEEVKSKEKVIYW